MLGEPAAHGSRLLGSQVQGLVLLSLVEFPEVFLLSLINDSEDTGDGFAHDLYLVSWRAWMRRRLSLWTREAGTFPPSDRPVVSIAPPPSCCAGPKPHCSLVVILTAALMQHYRCKQPQTATEPVMIWQHRLLSLFCVKGSGRRGHGIVLATQMWARKLSIQHHCSSQTVNWAGNTRL